MTVAVKTMVPASALEKIECALIERLKENMPGFCKVEGFPANPDGYDFAGLEAASLVHYSGSQFAGRKGEMTVNQMRRMNFSVVVLARDLRGAKGAYGLLEAVRQLIQGETFEGAGPAEIVRDELINENKGQWRWDVTFGLTMPAVAFDRQRPAPLMRPQSHFA